MNEGKIYKEDEWPFESEGFWAGDELDLDNLPPDDDEPEPGAPLEIILEAAALSNRRARERNPEYWARRDKETAIRKAAVKDAKKLLLPFSEFASNVSHPYLVKGLLFKGHATIIFGLPGEGKSTLAAELALAVAYGEPIAGMRVKPCPVLYIAFEREQDVQMRLYWLRKMKYEHRQDEPRIFMDKAKVSMTTSDYKAMLARQRAASFIACGEPLGLVIVDTLGLALGPDTEINDYDDINALFRAVNPAIMECGVAEAFIHHSGKDPSRGELGSIAIRGGASVSIELRDGEMRWRKPLGRRPSPQSYELEEFNIGIDEDGDDATVTGLKFEAQVARKGVSDAALALYDVMNPDKEYKGSDFYPVPYTRQKFRNAMKELVDGALVVKTGEREKARYQRTDGLMRGAKAPPSTIFPSVNPHDGEAE